MIDNILEVLVSLDRWAFYGINHGVSNPLFDSVMPVITSTTFWLPIYVIGIVFLIGRGIITRKTGGMRLVACAVVMLLGILLLDQAGHRLLKELIGRPRPYLVLPNVHHLVGSGGGSFPSNHAMNNAFIAVILSAWFPAFRPLWWTLAAVIMFSRPYCGVHYPSDVLGGAVIGLMAGYVALRLVRTRWPQFLNGQPPQSLPASP